MGHQDSENSELDDQVLMKFLSYNFAQREETWERPMEEGDEEKETKESVEFSENAKVPTLTISLRPGMNSAISHENSMIFQFVVHLSVNNVSVCP